MILCCKLQCGITQPILRLVWHICIGHGFLNGKNINLKFNCLCLALYILFTIVHFKIWHIHFKTSRCMGLRFASWVLILASTGHACKNQPQRIEAGWAWVPYLRPDRTLICQITPSTLPKGGAKLWPLGCVISANVSAVCSHRHPKRNNFASSV